MSEGSGNFWTNTRRTQYSLRDSVTIPVFSSSPVVSFVVGRPIRKGEEMGKPNPDLVTRPEERRSAERVSGDN